MIEVIEAESGDQPFKVHVTGNNNKLLVWGENLSSLEDAFTEIRAVAVQFGAREPIIQARDENYLLYGFGIIPCPIKVVKETST
jgi:hypothetical protein